MNLFTFTYFDDTNNEHVRRWAISRHNAENEQQACSDAGHIAGDISIIDVPNDRYSMAIFLNQYARFG